MRMIFNKWWLLASGIFAASALVVLGVVVLGPSLGSRPVAEVDQQAESEPAGSTEPAPTGCSDDTSSDSYCQPEEHQEAASEPVKASETAGATESAATGCSDGASTDFACLQRRYQNLVRDSGVELAFAELRNEIGRNQLASSKCHELTHVIGHTAAEIYGDVASTYSRGDSFCGSGYYHGAMEAVVIKVGADKVLEDADSLCDDLGGPGRRSFHHYNCAHGLGHGFMRIHENEMPESLDSCDSLSDDWERERCYGGVFMENVVDSDNPEHPSKYLEAGQPLYPCDALESKYRNECYQRQTAYALKIRSNDFAEVFNLCAEIEDEDRPACYQGLGWDASVQSLKQGGDVNQSTRALCMLGAGYEAQSNCVIGAVEYFVRHYYSDTQARSFCESFGTDLRALCLREAEEYYGSFRSRLE